MTTTKGGTFRVERSTTIDAPTERPRTWGLEGLKAVAQR